MQKCAAACLYAMAHRSSKQHKSCVYVMSGSRLVIGTLPVSRDSDATVLNIYMAFLVVPVVGGGVGGLAGVALAWSYTKAANVTAEQLYGLHDAYPWPMYKPWFDHRVKSNATNTGTLAALLFGAVAFSVQRRYIFNPIVKQLWGSTSAGDAKIDNFVQFAKHVGPGLGAAGLSLTSTTVMVGLVRPAIDGKNVHITHNAHFEPH